MNFNNYFQAVKFLESIPNIPKPELMRSKGSSFYLHRTRELIKNLNIDLKQFKYIHIAGTSGKGSTTAMVHQILYAAGKKVGSFYSPHPTTSIERIKVGSKYISPHNFAKLINKIKPALNKMYTDSKYGIPSYFEIFFALALLYFRQKKCEYIILETGCGGEFDATNIIKKPLITAITNIGFDHTHLLGNTLKKIATTKSKIIKPKSIFITTEQRPHLLKIFENECKHKHAAYRICAGSNAILASAICQHLNIKKEYINTSLKSFSLPCRFEIIQANPTIILDGAHNSDKMKSTVDNLKKLKYNKLHLIFTLNENKNVKKIISIIAPHANYAYITRHLTISRPCADLKFMYNLFSSANSKIFIDPWQALVSALKSASKNDLILITGSFYLAGELRKNWIPEKQILKDNS